MAPLTPTHSQCSLDSFFDPFMDDDVELFLIPLQTKRKRVRINPDWILLDYVQHVSELTPEDRVRGWWSKDEYEATKLAAKTKCRELRRKGAFKGCLTDAYEQACNVADNATPGHDDLISCETRDQLVPRSGLLEWCEGFESSRGLERWSSKVHGFLRGKHVGQVKHAVLLEQARQFLLNEHNADVIADVAADASRRSRAFARLLGVADAISASECRKRDADHSEDEKPLKRTKTVLRSSPTEPVVLSDDDSDDEPQIPSFIDVDALQGIQY